MMVATVMKTRRKREVEETKEVRAEWRRENMAVRGLTRRWRSPALYLCHMASERSEVRYECVCCVCVLVSQPWCYQAAAAVSLQPRRRRQCVNKQLKLRTFCVCLT